jgi:hypothetical protein
VCIPGGSYSRIKQCKSISLPQYICGWQKPTLDFEGVQNLEQKKDLFLYLQGFLALLSLITLKPIVMGLSMAFGRHV